MPLHAEPQRWRLTGTVRDDTVIEPGVFGLKSPGLKTCEGAPDSKVQLLPGVHRPSLILVRSGERIEGFHDAALSDGRKPCPEDCLERRREGRG